mmetsp:Transcript_126315/g.252385  ORF Transcript_126315/g.252385 Transcript_126315/m.252385 type:complete len:519 (-) Transcript_126315:73-1629(-)
MAPLSVIILALIFQHSHAYRDTNEDTDMSLSSTRSDVNFSVRKNEGCCEIRATTDNILDWLEYAGKYLESCNDCIDYGKAFGWWARSGGACPASWGAVATAVRQGTSRAEGGKSGAAVELTPEYVIKTIDDDEKRQLDSLFIFLLRMETSDRNSFLIPTCRTVRISGSNSDGRHMIVMPNSLLSHGDVSGRPLQFDLKGNFDYSGRRASFTATILKDANFHMLFPQGLDIVKVKFKNGQTPGWGQVRTFIDTVRSDTWSLLQKKLMDYSFLIDLVSLCPRIIRVTSEKSFTAFDEGKRLYLDNFVKSNIRLRQVHDGRPIYKNGNDEYLYYWAETGVWHIGIDYNRPSNGIASSTTNACPSYDSAWAVFHEREGWTYGYGVKVSSGDTRSVEKVIESLNPNKTLLWVNRHGSLANSQLQYIMTLSIIDMFMVEGSRGFWNLVGSGLTMSTCTTNDIDPIPAHEYRVRFLRMMGWKDPGYKSGSSCGSCLGNRRRESYTYLTSLHQRVEHLNQKCEWGT